MPGAGLIVVINDIPVRTDACGQFSLTGIADGTYMIDLNLPPDFLPAQPSQKINIVNRSRVNIELGYFSASSSIDEVTDFRETTQEDTAPAVLPETGGYFQSTFYPTNNLANFFILLGCGIGLLGKVRWRI